MSTLNFNDSIFAQEALTAFVAELVPLGAFSHSFSGETVVPGQAVYVPRIDALSATTFSYTDNSGFPYENSGGTINTITVNLDQHFITTVDFTDTQAANSSAVDWANIARLQGSTLGKAVWQRIATLWTTVNFGLAVANLSIGSYSRATTVSVRQTMAKRDVPVTKLSLIVNQDVMTSWLGDATIYQTYSSGLSSVQDGRISQLAGMKVYDNNVVPTNGISLVGVVAHPDSLAVACRYLEPQDSGPYASVIRAVDPSGIVMGYRRHMSAGRGKMFASFEAQFGFAVGLSLGLGILTRTD
jgi:hypothetical protein